MTADAKTEFRQWITDPAYITTVVGSLIIIACIGGNRELVGNHTGTELIRGMATMFILTHSVLIFMYLLLEYMNDEPIMPGIRYTLNLSVISVTISITADLLRFRYAPFIWSGMYVFLVGFTYFNPFLLRFFQKTKPDKKKENQ